MNRKTRFFPAVKSLIPLSLSRANHGTFQSPPHLPGCRALELAAALNLPRAPDLGLDEEVNPLQFCPKALSGVFVKFHQSFSNLFSDPRSSPGAPEFCFSAPGRSGNKLWNLDSCIRESTLFPPIRKRPLLPYAVDIGAFFLKSTNERSPQGYLGHRDDQPGMPKFSRRSRILTSITPFARPFKKV